MFQFSDKYPAAVHSTAVYVGAAGLLPRVTVAPAKPGEIIQLFGTGFRVTSPATASGKFVSTAFSLANPVTVTVGDASASVAFAGVTASGLDQINVAIPASLPDGDAALVIKVGSAAAQFNLYTTIQH